MQLNMCRYIANLWSLLMVYNYTCNTFTPQIKGSASFCGINVMYLNHSSPGVLQLPWRATTFQWNVIQLHIVMYIIMLQLPLVCYNDTRKPIQTGYNTTLYTDTPNLLSIMGFI